jgi:predicted glycoside hydrolase/deacetylase ChbG (UPF0249 family)
MPDSDKKIIISADDFGQSLGANINILKLLSQKKLQRISVMVNGEFSAEEIRLLLDSHVKLDLHLDFFSLLKNNLLFRKKTGAFVRLLAFLKYYLLGKISVFKVGRDWNAQLEKFNQIFGKYPDGLNSHQHIHFFPPYFKLILALARKSRITYLRLGKKDFMQTGNIVSLIIFFLRRINRRRFLDSGLASSDFLVSLDWIKKDPLGKIDRLPSGEIELIVHPERAAELEFIKTQ